MSALDAAIMSQLQSVKQANMANPMMAAAPAPMPGMPGQPPQAVPMQPVAGQQATNPNANLLSIAVSGLPFQYTLNEADLREMCQRWGQVTAVHMYLEGERQVGVAVFADPIDASDCQRQLNNHSCSFNTPHGLVSGALAAVIGEPMQLSPPINKGQMGAPQMPAPQMAAPMAVPGQPQMAVQGSMGKGMSKGPGAFPPGYWSCKVIVQAEALHHEFPTVTKVVGVDNANVNHIRTMGNLTVELRGHRSGLINPNTGQEHQEPMHLWMGSDTQESGAAALEMVKDLLGSVYDEHQQWCQANNLKWPENLQPHVVENPHLTEGY